MFWSNPIVNILIDSRITEWDIKSGNTSIMRQFNLAPVDRIEELEKMVKKDRVIMVGNMMKDKTFSKKLEEGFESVIEEFISENQIDTDSNVTDIMRDAVYVSNSPINIRDIGYCHFVPKNEYIGYMKFSNLKLFIGTDKIDVKGISDEDLVKHESGVLLMIRDIYNMCSEYSMDQYKMNMYFKDLVRAYRNKELILEYYQEFTSTGGYRINVGDRQILLPDITEEYLDDLDISYNYYHVLVPLIQILC